MIEILGIGDDPCFEQLVNKEEFRVCIYPDEIKGLAAAENVACPLIFLSYDVRKDETPEYISLLKQANHVSKIVLVGEGLADETVIDCLVKGAEGYISASELPKFLYKMVDAFRGGEVWVTRRMTVKLLDWLREIV